MSDDVILQPDDGYISFDLILARAAERQGDDDQQPTDSEEVSEDGQERT